MISTKIMPSSLIKVLAVIAVSVFLGFILDFFSGGREYLGSGIRTLNVGFFKVILFYFIPVMLGFEAVDRLLCIIVGWKFKINLDSIDVLVYGFRIKLKRSAIRALIVSDDSIFGGFTVSVKLGDDAPLFLRLLGGVNGAFGAGGQDVSMRALKVSKLKYPVIGLSDV